MATPMRRLPLQGMHNMRDLGGYATDDGGVTRFGWLFRSDAPTLLPEEDIAAILAAGIRTVIDLRASDEVARSPSSLELLDDVVCHGVSLLGDTNALRSHMGLSAGDSFIQSLTVLYASMVDVNAAQFARVFEWMAEGLRRGAVLFNCTAGKDRTGIVAALTLLLCGVSPYDVVADYMVTEVLLEPRIRRWAASTDAMEPPNIWKSEADTMRTFLAHLDGQYGGARPFLLGSGVKEETIKTIVDALVDRGCAAV